ncbi:MAG: acylphosphatase [Thaumarchaeota archaeon]|nr:acylphosphatase [Candidatus Geocrenenecus arthurdayi]
MARVYGRVQRVGYRRFILDTAQELGLSGYVKNERDGSVTIFTQGDEIILERFIEMVKSPPQPAYVKSIDIRDVKPRPAIKYFTIKPSPLHEELQEGFGAMQSIFMEYWREFRDFRSEFRDYRQEFRDFREEFRDYREEFRSFVNEFREFARRTDENFKMIMEKYGEISEKLTIILETLVKESRETREMLNETMKLLREALEKLSR